MPESTAEKKDYRVLVTEDSKTIRGFLCRHVRACLPDASLDECEHGAEAMGRLAQARVDLVITDLQMPNLGGEQFLRQAFERGHLASTAIIVISSAITPRVREALKMLPLITFLRKPATGVEIAEAIRTLVSPAVDGGALS